MRSLAMTCATVQLRKVPDKRPGVGALPASEGRREAARGFRLNIPAGTAVRFEAGDIKQVELVALTGLREVWGLNARINGKL